MNICKYIEWSVSIVDLQTTETHLARPLANTVAKLLNTGELNDRFNLTHFPVTPFDTNNTHYMYNKTKWHLLLTCCRYYDIK